MFKTLLRTLSALSITTIGLTAHINAGFAQDESSAVDCEIIANANDPACKVTTDSWRLIAIPEPNVAGNNFVSPDSNESMRVNSERVNIQFDDFNDNGIARRTTVGTVDFYRDETSNNIFKYYAGIRTGADLGAPVTEVTTTAIWKGRIKIVGNEVASDGGDATGFTFSKTFYLNVEFLGGGATQGVAGHVDAFVQHKGYYHYRIDAEFDNNGVITGRDGTDGVTYGRFQLNDQGKIVATKKVSAKLTGIIGERGALGAFYSTPGNPADDSDATVLGYAGGFRANGESEDEWELLKLCTTDPFDDQCSASRFNTIKKARIALCILGDRASKAVKEVSYECHNAIRKNNCIRDPFQDHCDAQLGDVYDRAQSERIEFCRENKNKLDLLCTEGRVADIVACDGNHFSVNCANEPDSIRARIDFCADANNAGDPKCNHLLSTPNAAGLSQSFNFEGLNTENRTNQFLQGTEAELTASKDGLTIEQPTDESSHEGSLNLAVLDGDASNGVSFFKGISGTSVFHYAGIFSSTDLGEPLTSTQPNAYWKGKFQVTGYLPSTDFTLEINFGDTGGAGNTDDDRVGRIQAFVRVRADSTQHFYVDGGFTDKGVITGDVTYAFFTNSNRKRPSSRKIKGEVRGLIGEKGAVAAFISNDAGHLGYAGGFVARQPTQTEKTGLDATCAFDPLNDKCEFGFEVERDAVIARCKDNLEQEIADGYCDDNDVRVFISDCEANPFAPKCVSLNSFKAKRADIVNRCADPDNADRTGCSNVTDIIADCNLNPFGVYCDVSEFEDKRTNFSTNCKDNGNCDTVQRTPNAATWNSTTNPFVDVFDDVNAANVDGGFVRGTEDNLAGGDGLVPANVTKLNLSTATFGGSDKPLGGEAADGLAFGTDSGNKYYAGIFSGTDLGAPVAQKVGRAIWVGWASVLRGGILSSEDFALEINFADRKIEAYTSVLAIIGDFNDNGVIDGKIEHILDTDSDILDLDSDLGTVSGLIGEEGAVGVFYKANKFSGGFVARPPNSDQMASLNATCTNPDFATEVYRSTKGQNTVYLANCHLKVVAEIDSLIKKCITGANAKTDECKDKTLLAVPVKAAVVACIKNPFGTGCGLALGDNHDVARDNRNEFCNNFLNAEHEFCKDDNLTLVCGYDPFNTICVGGAHYTKQEEICAAEQDSVRCRPTVARVCVDNSDIFNPVCGDDYNAPRLDICRNEYDNGPSVRCTATVTRICINDLFDDLCKHDAYFDNRVLACRDPDNQRDSLCTYTITTACQRDLFDPFCNTTHSDARKTRINLCNDLTSGVSEPNCMEDNLTNLCAYDPFNAVCPSSPSVDNKARAVELLGMCANSAQADNLDCISILKRPNAATLLQARPAETLVTTGQSNQFLNATKTTDLEKSGLDGLEAAVEAGTVRLLSGDARSLNLSVLDTAGVEGDADDGVGYAVVRNRNSSKFRHFAGIFSSTDLGAPLTQTNTKVGWKGKIQVPGYSLKSEDFTLEITFGNAGEGGKLEAFVFDSVNRYFHLKGGFDSKGLITGTARFGHFANHVRNEEPSKKVTGKLRGLIGQDGAVGAFVSGSSEFFGFGGGFVARPLTDGETTTLNNTCDMNPFDAKCDFGFDAVRSARVELCEQDSNASNRLCTGGAGAVITGCKANPFGADCTWDGFDAERETRVELCEQDSNAGNVLCTGGASAAITGCEANPFGTGCAWDTFNDTRNARLTICYDAAADDARCVGTAATIVTDCKANPFNADCTWNAFDAERNTRVELCDQDSNAGNDLCTGGANAVIINCKANLFSADCTWDVFDDARNTRVALCREGGLATDARCRSGANAVITDCKANPFGADCTWDGFDAERNTRLLSCQNPFRAWGVGCRSGAGADAIVTACKANPFGADCAWDAFNAERNTRIEFCRQDSNASNVLCTGGANAVITGCDANPFGRDCTWGAFDDTRNARVTICYDAAADDARCVGTAATIITDCKANVFGANCYFNAFKATRQDLLRACKDNTSDCTPSIKASMLTQPNAVTWKNTPASDITHDLVVPLTTYSTLNLSTATFGVGIIYYARGFHYGGVRTLLGGDAEDGVVVNRSSGVSKIFATTDLGAPVTDEKGTASWVGSFRADFPWSDFVLEVNFDDKSIEAVAAHLGGGSFGHHLKGDYDANGVISGTATFGWFVNYNRNNSASILPKVALPLTGLIGKEGAVGVFGSSGDYGEFVARPADLVNGAEAFLHETCEWKPFHPFCYLSVQREARIDLCITGNTAGTSICTSAIEYEPCILNPFDQICKTSFADHYELTRENRINFCNDSANVADDLCTGAEQSTLCSYNPFHTICANAIYDNARQAVCKSNPTSPKCVAIVTTICDATNGNIYHPSCGTAYDATRLTDLTTFCESATNANNPICVNEQVTFCSMHANAENIACAGNIPKKATTASWLAGFYKENGFIPQTEPDTIRLQSQFLQSTANRLDTGDVAVPRSGSLNLNTATFDGMRLDGDVADGVAFFEGSNGRYFAYYAGILSGTDLGAPVTETEGTANWYGQLKTIFFRTDFTLKINFGAGSRVGTADIFIHKPYSSVPGNLLKTEFDSDGVIYGTNNAGVPLNNYVKITGLIGQEGAVGVFLERSNFVGGFVASPSKNLFDPNVKYSDWLRSFDINSIPVSFAPYTETQQTRFLQGTDTGLNTGYLINAVPQTLTLADVNADGERADGVAYMSGTHRYGAQNTHHVAGILSGTNLGAVLEIRPAVNGRDAILHWEGKLGMIVNGASPVESNITLKVNYTDQNITLNRTAIGLGAVFFTDVRWDTNGVITEGVITYDQNYRTRDITGTVTGLIGQQGAVGAFISDGTGDIPYAGGFVAVPPSE